MTQPYKGAQPLAENQTLKHPVNRGTYRFLHVTREPTLDRPDSGRIKVENTVTKDQSEHYAILFDVRFR